MLNKVGIWIGLVSSAVTVVLTIYNAQLNQKIQETELQLKQVETDLKRRAQDLDVLKEKTSRYQFVNQLLPDLLKKDKAQVTLTTNLITLALTDEEARKLFDGLQASREKDVQEVGRLGSASLASQRDTLRSAQAHEAAAFEALVRGDYKTALSEFEEAERVYPTFHQAYEIARLLRRNLSSISEPAIRKSVLKQIVTQLSYGAPPEYLQKLEEISK
jgi:tetratricopeptide (TPR) repeat protein